MLSWLIISQKYTHAHNPCMPSLAHNCLYRYNCVKFFCSHASQCTLLQTVFHSLIFIPSFFGLFVSHFCFALLSCHLKMWFCKETNWIYSLLFKARSCHIATPSRYLGDVYITAIIIYNTYRNLTNFTQLLVALWAYVLSSLLVVSHLSGSSRQAMIIGNMAQLR